jgi:acyl dehydratase
VTSGEYRVVAVNPASASENRIHSDDVARRHGFRGGLVPGVTVYGYVVHALVDAFGPGWIATGRAGVRFRSPCYDGDHLTVRLSPGEAGSAVLEVTVGETRCVTGTASLGGETSGVYYERQLVHPGMILEGANRILAANVVLPPWLHVESEVGHVRAVEVGEPVTVRGRVAEEWDHRGHRFVALDVVWLVGPEAVARARHTAIWRLAGA